ncbi:hypothetical protein [Catellatospora tritici]|uniref:hypothetical protein n=1 Tax=Catellatospora tritici TaxID=2851566 RepID=UPI001C2D74B3|nr:hypothetical protein [Catellatospora tritici]MBV1853045.1 hypothetical protein [Catellatospora tritici]
MTIAARRRGVTGFDLARRRLAGSCQAPWTPLAGYRSGAGCGRQAMPVSAGQAALTLYGGSGMIHLPMVSEVGANS